MTDRLCEAIGRLHALMATLRSPGGCPWDAAQTPDSLKRYLVEETYEVLEALEHGPPTAIRDELGDLLLQIVFHARMFEERGEFTLADVATAIADKLVRRHPHVFAGGEVGTAEDLAAQWDRIKAGEKRGAERSAHPAADIPRTLPALLRARKVDEKLKGSESGHGAAALFEAAERRLARLREAFLAGNGAAFEATLGGLLFTVVQLGNRGDIDSEEALRKEIDRRVPGHHPSLFPKEV